MRKCEKGVSFVYACCERHFSVEHRVRNDRTKLSKIELNTKQTHYRFNALCEKGDLLFTKAETLFTNFEYDHNLTFAGTYHYTRRCKKIYSGIKLLWSFQVIPPRLWRESLPQYLIKQLLWVITRIIRSIYPQMKAMTKLQKNQIITLKPYDTAPKTLSQEGCIPPARYVSEKKKWKCWENIQQSGWCMQIGSCCASKHRYLQWD